MRTSKKSQSRNTKAFTIVEVTVVIVVIGILASVSVVAFGAWRTRTAENEVKSDLNGVQAAMENARNFSNGYPTSIPSSFSASDGVTLTYFSGDAKKYCIDGTSKAVSTVRYFLNVDDGGRVTRKGTCAAGPD